MKKILTILIPVLALILLVSACAKTPVVNQNTNQNTNQNVNINQNLNVDSTPTPTSSPTITVDIDTSGWKVCKFEKFRILIKYPRSWGECKTDDKITKYDKDKFGEFLIRTDYKPYVVYLEAGIRKGDLETIKSYKEGTYGFNIIKLNNREIFTVPCGGAISCTGVMFKENLYTFGWNVSSNEVPPKDLQEIWAPHHNIRDEDIINLMKTVEEY